MTVITAAQIAEIRDGRRRDLVGSEPADSRKSKPVGELHGSSFELSERGWLSWPSHDISDS